MVAYALLLLASLVAVDGGEVTHNQDATVGPGGLQVPETYTLTVTGSVEEAKRWENEADAIGRDPKALEKLWMSGIVFEALNSHLDAARVYGKIVSRFPADKRSADANMREGEQFKQATHMADAQTALRFMLANYSQSNLIPFTYFELIDVYIAQHKWDEAVTEATSFTKACQRSGVWKLETRSPELKGQVEDMLEEAEAIPGYVAQDKADQTGKPEDYARAAQLYRDFLTTHSTEAPAYRVNYLLAQCLLDSGDERGAAIEYLNTARGYNDDVKYKVALQQDFTRVDAANNAVFHYYDSWQHELKDVSGNVGQTKLQAAENAIVSNAPIPVHIVSPSSTSESLLEAVNFFLDHFGKDNRASDILAVKGEVLFWYGEYGESRQVYKRVLDDYAGTEANFAAAENIALSFLIERNYKEANTWYNYVVTLTRAKHREMVASRAELMLGGIELEQVGEMPGVSANGDQVNAKVHLNAAKSYQKVAEKTNVHDVADLARLRGSEQYLLADKPNDAEKMLRKIIEETPKSRFLWNAYYGLGEINLKAKKYDKAMEFYQTSLANADENPNGIAQAHFALARIYREQGKSADCLHELEGLTNSRFAAPSDIAQAYYLQGQVMGESGNRDGANGRYGNAFLFYTDLVQKGEADPTAAYWAGKARLEIANDYANRAFGEKLTGDDTKDKAIFTHKMDYYAKARDACYDALKTRNAPVMTEALTRLGGIFENISEDILSTPRPNGLTSDEGKLYDAALHGKMNPLLERAVQAYSKCLSLADSLKYEDEWTKKSGTRLTELLARGTDAATSRVAISTDSTWKVAGLVADSHWMDPDYDDLSWVQARDITPNSTSASNLLNGSGRRVWGNPGDEMIYLRNKIDISSLPASQIITISAGGPWKLYLNGKQISSGDGKNTLELDVAPNLMRGGNVMAVEVEAISSGNGFFQVSTQ